MALERRISPRIQTYLPVRVHQLGTVQVVETLTKNLSSAGFRCLSPTLYPVSTQLRVQLILGSGSETLDLVGRLVWFHMIPQSEQFDLGVTFVENSEHNKRRLSAYIDLLLEKFTSRPA